MAIPAPGNHGRNELFSNGFQTFDINPYGYRAKNNLNLSFDQQITEDFAALRACLLE